MSVRSLIQGNCRFLQSIVCEYPYLQLPDALRIQVERAIDEVTRKIDSPQLRVAVVGGFSSGKSTLINALLGSRLLESRAVPTTVCPTCIVRSPSTSVTIQGNWGSGGCMESGIPSEVTLKSRYGEQTPMVHIGSGIYEAEVTMRRRGIHETTILADSIPVETVRVTNLSGGPCETQVYYSLLTGSASNSDEYSHIPENRLPKVSVEGSDGMQKYVLRSLMLDNRWSATVEVPESRVRMQLEFDWEWFAKAGFWRLRPKTRLSLWERFKRQWSPTIGFEKVRISGSTPGSIVLNNTGGTTTRAIVTLDLDRLEFDSAPATVSNRFQRKFGLIDAKDLEKASNLISMLTTAGRRADSLNDFSGNVEEVLVGSPGVQVPEFVTIIDTPGIAANSRHTTKTIDIVTNLADACIFLCPAEQAGTLGDLLFIERNLMDIVGEVVFVITKADQAGDEDELSELVESVKTKISQKLGLAAPRVYATSAQSALNGDSEGRSRFAEFTDKVTRFAEANRDRILLSRLINTESSVMRHLAETARAAQERFSERLFELQAHVITDLQEFVEREARAVDQEIDTLAETDAIILSFNRHLRNVTVQCLEDICKMISEAKSKDELKAICGRPLEAEYAKMGSRQRAKFDAHARVTDERLLEVAANAVASFGARFEDEYSLKKLGGTTVRLMPETSIRQFATVSAGQELLLANQAVDAENKTMVWGGGAGALVGTFVLPGVGTLLGWLAGSFLGGLFGPSLDTVKAGVMEEIGGRVMGEFESVVASQVQGFVYRRLAEVKTAARAVLSDYVTQYQSEIDRLIGQHEVEKVKVGKYVTDCDELVSCLDRQIHSLRKLRQELDRGQMSFE